MNSIVICEGETDATLLQYYLENKYGNEKIGIKIFLHFMCICTLVATL